MSMARLHREAPGDDVSDEMMRGSVVAPGNVIHHASRTGYSEPTTCGRTEVPKPVTDVWANVTCGECLRQRPGWTEDTCDNHPDVVATDYFPDGRRLCDACGSGEDIDAPAASLHQRKT